MEQARWLDVDFVLDPIKNYRRIGTQRGAVLNIPSKTGPSIGIISDIDDTIVESYATDLLMTARMVFAHLDQLGRHDRLSEHLITCLANLATKLSTYGLQSK